MKNGLHAGVCVRVWGGAGMEVTAKQGASV